MNDLSSTLGPHGLPSGIASELLCILDAAGDDTSGQDAAIAAVVARRPEHARSIAALVDDYRRAEAAATPTRFGPYRVLDVLGEGGMGVVYRAVHETVGHEVALKCMRREWAGDEPRRRRFEREVAAIARLDHPCICRMFEYGEADGTPYFAMQLVDGVPLDRLLHEARAGRPCAYAGAAGLVAGPPATPDIARVVAFVRQLLEALHAAHTRGFVHRDIKPGNIMVDRRGQPVVLDFGLVFDAGTGDERLTLSQMTLGTPGYMAPEQITGRLGEIGPATDLHAVGLVLYELLAGQPAYSAASLFELQRCILRRELLPLRRRSPTVSRDLEAIVEMATATEPARRYVAAEAFADDLRRLLAHEPIVARRVGPVRRARRWMQRNPLIATVLVSLALALLLTGRLLYVTRTAAASTRQHLDRFFRLATAERLRAAEHEAQALYPASPANAPKLAAWLARYADPLAAELPRAREVLAELAAAPGEGGPRGGIAAEGVTADWAMDGRTPNERTASAFLARTLTEVVPHLEAFLAPETGLVADVRRRLQWASTVTVRSVTAHADAWQRAAAALATADGSGAHAGYAGLTLVPQVGLVPLGIDPDSHLWEFYDLASAQGDSLPTRDEHGRLHMQPDMGVVFVLVPGGAFAMGSQVDADPNRDAESEVDERPVRSVTLAPFFLSKFELTQAQWQRLTGQTPSAYSVAMNDTLPADAPRFTLANPVESVAWEACAEVARRQGWLLPTEAQWEYACRAGSTTPFSFGAAGPDCARYANVADRTAQRLARGWQNFEAWDDGHVAHAPVGSFEPNAFGLFDMHGNVLEFCADWKLPYEVDPAPVTGLREPAAGGPAAQFRVARGGCYYLPAVNARSADRHHYKPDDASTFAGWRPARGIDPGALPGEGAADATGAGKPR